MGDASTAGDAAAVGYLGTSITDDASTSDIATSTTQTIDVGASDSGVGELIGVSSTLPVDDTPTGDVRSSSDGVRAPINDDDDVIGRFSRSAQLVLCQSVVPQTTTMMMISRLTASMLRPMGKMPQRATRKPFP